MNIYLVRHTEVDMKEPICYGYSDIPLKDTFKVEANFVKRNLPAEPNTIYYSSPSKRCIKLLEFITDSDYFLDKRLCELNFGDWEKKPWNDLEKLPEFREWADNFVKIRLPHGESYNDLSIRVNEFFQEITHIYLQQNVRNIIIISHGGPIRAIISNIKKIPLKNSFKFKIDYHSITKIKVRFGSLKATSDLHSINLKTIIEYENKTHSQDNYR